MATLTTKNWKDPTENGGPKPAIVPFTNPKKMISHNRDSERELWLQERLLPCYLIALVGTMLNVSPIVLFS